MPRTQTLPVEAEPEVPAEVTLPLDWMGTALAWFLGTSALAVFSMLIPAILLFVAFGGLAAMGVSEAVALPALAVGFGFGLLLSWLVPFAVVWPRAQRSIARAGRARFRPGEVDAGGAVLAPTRLVLSGRLGQTLTLSAEVDGKRRKIWSGLPKRGSELAFPLLIERVRTAARIVGVELVLEVDEARWRRWDADPGYASEARYYAALEASVNRYPDLHAVEPRRPDDLRVDEVGFRWRGVQPSRQGVRYLGTVLPWSEIRDVQVRFHQYYQMAGSYQRSGRSYRWAGERGEMLVEGRVFALRSDGVPIRLLTTVLPDPVPGAASLHWLVEELRAAAEVAPERGSALDVPPELAAIGAPEG